MARVTVTLNGRTYRLQCGDGEERRVLQLATYVGQCMDGVVAEFGELSDERALILVALSLADELYQVKEQLAARS